MNRRAVVFGLGALWNGVTQGAGPGAGPALRTIGVFWIATPSDTTLATALSDGLRGHGLIEGQSIRIDQTFLVTDYGALPQAALELVARKPRVIVSYGATAIAALRRATSTIPVVAITGSDPVELGIAQALARPGGNVTGVTYASVDLQAKRLQLLRELVPDSRLFGIVFSPASPSEVTNLAGWQESAAKLNVSIRPIEVRERGDIERIPSKVAEHRVQALVIVPSSMFVANRASVVRAVLDSGLPALFGAPEDVEIGALCAYGTSIPEVMRYAAGHVVKILQGADPAYLPFEQSPTFQLWINARTAEALRIQVPRAFLARADRVIK